LGVCLFLFTGAAGAAIMESDYYVVGDLAFLMGPDPALFAIGDLVHVVADVNGNTLNSFYYTVDSSILGFLYKENFILSDFNPDFALGNSCSQNPLKRRVSGFNLAYN
jgi:hypothetical protein